MSFYFTLPETLPVLSPAGRFKANLEALRLLKRGGPYSEGEALSLVQYSGWGSSAVLSHARKEVVSYPGKSYESRSRSRTEPSPELEALTTKEEWTGILNSSLNAHYTSLEIIRAIWGGIQRLGLSPQSIGRPLAILEPSCGVGHFLGAAPDEYRGDGARWDMVELDPLTAGIAAALYPETRVTQSGFEHWQRGRGGVRLLQDYYDLVISNVPFGKLRVNDPGMSPSAATESLHNYFITRMLELVRPGGLVVAITSRYSLDGSTSGGACRQAWGGKAQLLGACRLPDVTFRENAGTDVVTDVLFLRRLLPGEIGNSSEWVGLDEVEVLAPDTHYYYGEEAKKAHPDIPMPGVKRNHWYTLHPDLLLGKERMSGKMNARSVGGQKAYRDEDLTHDEIAGDFVMDPTAPGYHSFRSKERVAQDSWKRQVEKQGSYNLEWTGPDSPASALSQALAGILPEGACSLPTDQTSPAPAPTVISTLSREAEYVPQTPAQKAWWLVYRAAKAVIASQVTRGTDEELAALQGVLREVYQYARNTFGRPGSPAVAKEFRDREDILSFLLALERPDGTPEAFFSERTIYPQPDPLAGVTDPIDALYCCLDTLGRVDLPWIGKTLGRDPGEVRDLLTGRIYLDPEGGYVLAEDYLSGNVRRKLQIARARATVDPRYLENVPALETVQLPDLGKEDVDLSLKSPWIPEHIMGTFCAWVAGIEDNGVLGARRAAGSWCLHWLDGADRTQVAKSWSTERAPLGFLLQSGMDGRAPLIHDDVKELDGEGRERTRTVLNQQESVLAQGKLEELQAEFRRWCWEDSERAAELLECYNDQYNCHVPRKWDGSFLTLPGQNKNISLRPLQMAGVARVLLFDGKNHPLLLWPTGAGKTYGAIAGAEKRIQLGLTRKVLITCPKGVVAQWVDAYRALFPGRADQILAAGKDSLSKKERGVFLSRIATGGYRVIILSHQQFKSLPVREETLQATLGEQLGELEAAIKDQESKDPGMHSGEGGRRNVTLKRLMAAKKNLETKIRDLSEKTKKDSADTVTWEELGIDMLVGDEAQVWKNLQVVTRMGNVSGIRSGSSQISLDFLIKLRHLQAQGGLAVLTTATPVTNSLAESYVFASYLQRGTLRDMGIESADSFFGAFTRTESSVELEPSCASYRVVSRLIFGNLPELVAMLRQSWHVVRPEDVGVIVPEMAGGKEQIVQVPASFELKTYIQDLAARVRDVKSGKVLPTEDNMLKICSDGRWASLVNGPPTKGEPRDTKLDRVIERVLEHYQETQAERGAQIVFCDLGTPTGERVAEPVESSDPETGSALVGGAGIAQERVYEYVRAGLVAAGVPRAEIEFLQEHQGDPEKLRRLYAKVNSGEVRVLLGSAPTGMNVQERLIALHHIDPVWRPDWKIQRDGRILRQGNRYGKVYIYLYLTEGSFDAYMWGLIRAKLRVITQITSGEVDVRRLDGDVGDVVLRASEIQAIASGNPKVITFVGVQNELAKLAALRQEWERSQAQNARKRIEYPAEIARIRNVQAQIQETIQISQEPEQWEAFVGGIRYEKRKDAGEALAVAAAKDLLGEGRILGVYRGMSLSTIAAGEGIRLAYGNTYVAVDFRNVVGIWASLDHALRKLTEKVEWLERRIPDLERDLAVLRADTSRGWERGPEYGKLWTKYYALAGSLKDLGVVPQAFPDPETGWVPPPPAMDIPPVKGKQLLLFTQRRNAA